MDFVQWACTPTEVIAFVVVVLPESHDTHFVHDMELAGPIEVQNRLERSKILNKIEISIILTMNIH